MASAERDVDRDVAQANTATAPREQLFNQFYDSTDFQEILRLFQSLCSEISVDSAQYDG